MEEFNAKYPHFQLEKQANAYGIGTQYIQEMVVGQPEFMAAADQEALTDLITKFFA